MDSSTEFDKIRAQNPDLEQLDTILTTPTPPWKEAAGKILLLKKTQMTDAVKNCIEKIDQAREKDPLFVDMLKELHLDAINKIDGRNAYKATYPMMGNNINEICISLAADITRLLPNPRDAEELQQIHDSPEKRNALLKAQEEALTTYPKAYEQNTLPSPKHEFDQRAAHAKIDLDPERRTAARKHVLGVVYGDRYLDHLLQQKK